MSRFSNDLAVMEREGFRFNGNALKLPVYHVEGVSVEELNLGARASNGLKRAGLMTIDQVLEVDISKARNLGVKSVKEIKNAILNYSYEHMTDKQRAEFWISVLA